jgi:hypothetical protein
MAPALGNRHASQDSSQETCQPAVANRAAAIAMTQGLLIAQFSQDLALLASRAGSEAAKSPPETHRPPPKPNLPERVDFPEPSEKTAPPDPPPAPTQRTRPIADGPLVGTPTAYVVAAFGGKTVRCCRRWRWHRHRVKLAAARRPMQRARCCGSGRSCGLIAERVPKRVISF